MWLRTGFIGLTLVFGVSGCGGGGDSGGGEPIGPPTAGVLIEHVVAAAATDVNISTWLDNHYAYRDARVTARGRLLVYLPGSYGKPVNSLRYLKEIAAAGDHVIGLRYPNTWEVVDLCASATDLACFENVRLEIIDGTDRGGLVSVSTANSIVNRLAKMLLYLDTNYPTEGWGQFLTTGQPNWSLIAMSGHSQGAGHSAVMGKYYVLDRVLMFGAPGDSNSNGIAPWQNRTHATPTAGYYGFNHLRDTWLIKLAVWTLLGLADFGAAVSVDGAIAPFGNSHMLNTDALPATGNYNDAHGAVVTDDNTPLLPDGTPLFAPVWRYMCCS